MMPISALIVPVPEAESLVGDMRLRFDDTALLGVPAHVTILAPFMSPEAITNEVLAAIRDVVSSLPAFRFTLDEVCRWPDTTYLSTTPEMPFIQLTQRLVAQFPDFRPYGGQHREIVPHLTVAHGDRHAANLAEAELRPRLEALGAIQGFCRELLLLENSSGNWRKMHIVPLAKDDACSDDSERHVASPPDQFPPGV